ncbi:hypothetical protein PE066_05980 [Ramlibacter tataouinensis]|uniref:hypothetical protein n=1 Tax=Ramlibacter tataouinensis TaxID=94132 RepID=UPI0022F3C6EE|nr:hypothetical protein [Ramlibacter tataouinensis]WBY03085.1 hypothetical protein PE066_05980 [Ramlibacter tataouinensis]
MSDRLARDVEAMEGALREHVLPKLDDTFARGQVYGVIYMLRHLLLHADSSLAPMARQVDRLRTLEQELAALGWRSGRPALPEVCANLATAPQAVAAHREALDAGLAWLEALVHRSFDAARLPGSQVPSAVSRAIRSCASDVNAIAAKLTPAPMFAQIATGQEPAEAGSRA